jgi:hypothetical protein
MAYDRLDPIGEWRGDVRNAQLIAAMVNLFLARFGKKGVKDKQPIDFMPKWDPEEAQKSKVQSVDEMKNKIKGIGEWFKGKKKKDE